MSRFKKYFLLAAIISIGSIGMSLVLSQSASALSGSEFNPSYIIDDYIFFNKNTMDTGAIQNFLNAKVPSCDTNGTQQHHTGRTRAQHGIANGVPPPYTCLKDYSVTFSSKAADAYCGAITGGTKSAANIIFDVAQACDINPQTLIVLLQKEQSLITDDWPWPIQYRSATGYGCPDTAACDSQYYGFFNQVYNAGRQFKRYVALPGSFNYAVGRNSYILYNPNSGCGGTSLTLQTSATAALYNYTPYQPNQAALNNLYSAGDGCSAYGNRNFWRMFHDWFGPTTGNGFIRAKADNCSSGCAQYVVYGGLKQYIPSSEILNAWGLTDSAAPLISVDANYLASLPAGPNLDKLMRHNANSGVLYFVDGGKRYIVTRTEQLAAWNLSAMATSYVSARLFNLPTDGGYLTFSVKHPSNSNIYMAEGVNGSGQVILRQYQNETVFKAWEGDSATYNTFSSEFFGAIDNAIGSALTTTKITYGGNEYQAVNGYRMGQPASHAALYPGTAQAVSAATFNRLMPTANVSYLVRSKSSPSLYLIDGGQKRHIQYPDLLTAWAFPGAGYHVLEDSYVSLLPTGTPLSGYRAEASGQLYAMNGYKHPVPAELDDAYRNSGSVETVSVTLMNLFPTAGSVSGFIKGRTTPQVYLLDNSGNRRHIEWTDKLVLWGGSQGITTFEDFFINAIGTATSPQLFVSDGTTEYVMTNGKKVTVSAQVKAEWGLSSPQVFSDGTLARFATDGSLETKLRGNGAYFLIHDGAAFATADSNIADMWSIDDATERDPRLVSQLVTVYMLTRFVRSSTDSRVFLIDSGNWYNLLPGPRNNLMLVNEPAMTLNPNNAPNLITDWTNFVIKNSQGKHWVIDGGGKRDFPHQMIQDHWTGHGSMTVPTVTNGFINTLPYHGIIERTVKGTSPMVYSAENGSKRHILYPNTYQLYYAPYGTVSERLLDTMPNGSPL